MRAILLKILAYVELTRIGLVLTAVSNIWLVVLWARHVQIGGSSIDLPLWEHLGLTAGVAIGLYLFGMVGNDVFDARRDGIFASHRPLPSKRIRITTATSLAITALLLAILCSVGLGVPSTLFCLASAGLVVFYNSAAKFMPAVGLLTLGLIRASHMLIGDPKLVFCWPVWLVMTHVIVISAVAHRLEHKRPYLSKPELWGLSAGWTFWSLALILWMSQRDGLTLYHMPWVWGPPVGVGLVFLVVVIAIAGKPTDERAAGRAVIRLGLTWLILFDGSWLLGAQRWIEATVFGVLLILTLGMVHGTRTLQAFVSREVYRSDRSG